MGSRYEHLSAEERGTVMALTSQGVSMLRVALVLSRSPSTVSRELRRNGYRPADERGSMGRPPIAGGYDARLAGCRARRPLRSE